MSCENVRPLIASLIDRQLPAGVTGAQREEAMAHLAACRPCGAEYEAFQWRRAALRSLAAPAVPANLAAKLRVIASHERARQLTRITLRARLEALRSQFSLQF